jgi:hypothetical protein
MPTNPNPNEKIGVASKMKNSQVFFTMNTQRSNTMNATMQNKLQVFLSSTIQRRK